MMDGTADVPPEAGDVEEHVSAFGYAETVDRLVRAVEAAGMTVFARIDHAAGARAAGLEMPPTMVLIYGSPKGGTPAMLAAPSAALDLPLRVLVREAADGRTLAAFHPVAAMLARSGVPADVAAKLAPAQRLIKDAVAADRPADRVEGPHP